MAEIDEAAGWIEEAAQIVLACHLGPDGDALGSMLAMAAAAAGRGRSVWAGFGPPEQASDEFAFLPLGLLAPIADIPSEPELMMTFDAASIDRLGDLATHAEKARRLIVVDHHASNPGFGHINLIDPNAAATAQVTFRLLKRLGWELDPVTATCLLTGLVTDTGRFQYSNAQPETFQIAAALVEAGARPEVIGRHIYEESPFAYLAVEAAVLARAELDADLGLVWSVLWLSDLEEAGIGMEDADHLIDSVRVAREAEVALLVKEQPDGAVKASLRSRGAVDVGAIAVAQGGGGHHNASGFTGQGTAAEAVAVVRKALGG